jgi:hypothetical protein
MCTHEKQTNSDQVEAETKAKSTLASTLPGFIDTALNGAHEMLRDCMVNGICPMNIILHADIMLIWVIALNFF